MSTVHVPDQSTCYIYQNYYRHYHYYRDYGQIFLLIAVADARTNLAFE